MRVFRSGLVGLALVLIAQGLGPGGASAANQSVSIVNFGFQPTPLSSTVGDIVTWTNTTASTPHTVTRCDAGCPVGPGSGTDSGFGSTAIINGGGTYSHTFTAPGSYIYYCQVHGYAAMHAEVDVVTSPLLRAVSSPALPTQILVDGQIADSWGLTWVKMPAGPHTVSFAHVDGYTEPAPQNVTLTSGATTMVTGSFTQRGSLRVITSPAVPSQIKVDGNPTDDWGMWTDVPTGSHTVCFGAVAGFNPPACQTVTVNAGALTTVTGTFTTNPSAPGQTGVGLLRAVTSPAAPSQITIKPSAGSPYIADHWGLNWLELPPGSYTVTFSHVTGYTEPAPQTISITAGNTTTVTGSFTQRGTLRVLTSPAAPGTISVDGVPRNDWGMWTDIPTGSHMVCFGLASGFANTPPCQTTTVNAGVETDVTGMYS
jgi:plastocyanin